jgi:hypothetical protein
MRLLASIFIITASCAIIATAGESKETHLVRAGFYCFDVPGDYSVVQTSSWRDAWSGYIEPPDHSWRVAWNIGLYEKLLRPAPGRRIVWQREEEFHGKKWPIGLVEDDKVRTLVLGKEELQLSIPADIKDALEILGRIAAMARLKKEGDVCIPPVQPKL